MESHCDDRGDETSPLLSEEGETAGDPAQIRAEEFIMADLYLRLRKMRRDDLIRVLLTATVLGVVAAAVTYLPHYNHSPTGSFLMPFVASFFCMKFTGQSLLQGLLTIKTFCQIIFTAWTVAAIRNCIPSSGGQAAFSWCAALVCMVFFSLFLPGRERNLSFGFTPLLIFAQFPEPPYRYFGSHFFWLALGCVLGILISLPLMFPPFTCKPQDRTSFKRVNYALAQSAKLLDEAYFYLLIQLPLSVIDDEKLNKVGVRSHASQSKIVKLDLNDEKQLLSFEQSLTNVGTLLNTAAEFLRELGPLQINSIALEPKFDERRVAIIIECNQHVTRLLEYAETCYKSLSSTSGLDLLSIERLRHDRTGNTAENSFVTEHALNTARMGQRVCAELRALVASLDSHLELEERSIPDEVVAPNSMVEILEMFYSLSEHPAETFAFSAGERFFLSQSVHSQTMVYCALQIQTIVTNPPEYSRWRHLGKVVRFYMAPRRFYKVPANKVTWYEMVLASRVVLAVAIAGLWAVVPGLYEGQSNSIAFVKLKGEVALTAGIVWVDQVGGAMRRFLERATGVLIGVVASATYFMYIPAFPYTVIPWYGVVFPILFLTGLERHNTYIMTVTTAALSSFLVTFDVSVSNLLEFARNNEASPGDIVSPAARKYAFAICMQRVLATVYGLLIALLVATLYFPQHPSKSFYQAVEHALGILHECFLNESKRQSSGNESIGSTILKKKGIIDQAFDSNIKLARAIAGVQLAGKEAIAQYSWLADPFPQNLPAEVMSALNNLHASASALRQARLMTSHISSFSESEAFASIQITFFSELCQVLSLLSKVCSNAATSYFGTFQIDWDSISLCQCITRMNAFTSSFDTMRLQIESAFISHESLESPETRRDLRLFYFAHQRAYHSVFQLLRSLRVYQVIQRVPESGKPEVPTVIF